MTVGSRPASDNREQAFATIAGTRARATGPRGLSPGGCGRSGADEIGERPRLQQDRVGAADYPDRLTVEVQRRDLEPGGVGPLELHHAIDLADQPRVVAHLD